LSDFVRPSFEE